jgi:FdhD protein
MLSKSSFSSVSVTKCQLGTCAELEDFVAEEVPVALIYNGISHVVMLASPHDLEDFALGFSLAEGILEQPNQLYGLEIVQQDNGIELHLEIAAERFYLLKDRRRSMAGRTGCGLCGAESLAQALRLPEVEIKNSRVFDESMIRNALAGIESLQVLQAKTGATHASAWADVDGNLLMLREDVGRHNALDKLLGARAKADLGDGCVITTSRASYEMVQKIAVAGVSMLIAISAPTGLAIRVAEKCGICLIGFARASQYVVYTHPERLNIKKK